MSPSDDPQAAAPGPTHGRWGSDLLRASWQGGALVGLVTLGLGIVVTLHPSTSIDVIAVLLGVLLLISGVFHLIRALDKSSASRAWSAMVGLAFVVLGIILIRHLHVTRDLIALFIGLIWIVQGVAELLTAADDTHQGRIWSAVFGTISLAAGIVVMVYSTSSLNTLAVLLGVWFIVLGVLQLGGAFYLRHLVSRLPRRQGGDPEGPPGPVTSGPPGP